MPELVFMETKSLRYLLLLFHRHPPRLRVHTLIDDGATTIEDGATFVASVVRGCYVVLSR